MGFTRPSTVEVEVRELVKVEAALREIEKNLEERLHPQRVVIANAVGRIEEVVRKARGLDRPRYECVD